VRWRVGWSCTRFGSEELPGRHSMEAALEVRTLPPGCRVSGRRPVVRMPDTRLPCVRSPLHW